MKYTLNPKCSNDRFAAIESHVRSEITQVYSQPLGIDPDRFPQKNQKQLWRLGLKGLCVVGLLYLTTFVLGRAWYLAVNLLLGSVLALVVFLFLALFSNTDSPEKEQDS